MKLVFQCCICLRYRTEEDQYKVFLPICPYILISHGYCIECLKKHYPESDWVKSRED